MIKLERFNPSHLAQLKDWGYHDDPRFQHYDFKGFDKHDYFQWYCYKQGFINKRLYAILADSELVGFMTMKSINWCNRQAEMGIVINPSRLSRGYGSMAIHLFLKQFFGDYQFHELYLKVADFNRRAIRSYTKNGFVIVKSVVEPYEIQTNPFAIIMADRDNFFMKDSQVMTLVHTMSIDWQSYTTKANDYKTNI